MMAETDNFRYRLNGDSGCVDTRDTHPTKSDDHIIIIGYICIWLGHIYVILLYVYVAN